MRGCRANRRGKASAGRWSPRAPEVGLATANRLVSQALARPGSERPVVMAKSIRDGRDPTASRYRSENMRGADKRLPMSSPRSAPSSARLGMRPAAPAPGAISRQRLASLLHVPLTPQVHGVTAHAEPAGDFPRRQTVAEQENQTAPERGPLRRRRRANPALERRAIALANEHLP